MKTWNWSLKSCCLPLGSSRLLNCTFYLCNYSQRHNVAYQYPQRSIEFVSVILFASWLFFYHFDMLQNWLRRSGYHNLRHFQHRYYYQTPLQVLSLHQILDNPKQRCLIQCSMTLPRLGCIHTYLDSRP